MRFYNAFGPNPRALRMFLHEKGLTLDPIELDVDGRENRRPPYIDKNPTGQVPALELDDGRVIGETVAIFGYLEELFPNPPLIGANAVERAQTRYWQRVIEFRITEPAFNAVRYNAVRYLGEAWREFFTGRMPLIPEAADGLERVVRVNLEWLEGQMKGKTWILGDRFTIADIILYATVDFRASINFGLDPALKNLTAWKARGAARPSAAASLHPVSAQAKMAG